MEALRGGGCFSWARYPCKPNHFARAAGAVMGDFMVNSFFDGIWERANKGVRAQPCRVGVTRE